MSFVIRHAQVFCADGQFRSIDVGVEQGRIVLDAPVGGEVIDGTGHYLTPGLVDIHTHGAVGEDASDGKAEGLEKFAAYEYAQGITSFLPTTVALPEAPLVHAAETIRPLVGQVAPGKATIRGINLEGPYFNAQKKGAHEVQYLIDFDEGMYRRIQAASGGNILLVDGAPELPSGLSFIRAIADDPAVFSIAHTMATYDQAIAAFDAGARHVTHLFNAMPPYHHRDPGVVGAAAERADFVEMICDGIHLHPAVIRNMFALFTSRRICLISDSMRGTGLSDGDYILGDLTVSIENGVASLPDGTLAGSTTNLAECLRRVVSFGISKEDAFRAATINPAKAVGLDGSIGSIETGKTADLVLWDEELQPVKVWIAGQI